MLQWSHVIFLVPALLHKVSV